MNQTYARIVDGVVWEIIPPHPDGFALADRFPAALIETLVPAGPEVEPGWRWDGEGFASPVQGLASPAAAPPALPPIRRITALAFRWRLGIERRRAITLAASAAMEGGDATLQVFLDDLSAAGSINLDAAQTQEGVALLTRAGLLDAAEAEALLADGTIEEAI